MKIAIDVTNTTKKAKPDKDDLLLYDGRKWYITTKKEVFNELENKINEAIVRYSNKYNELALKYAKLEEENREFKAKVSSQMLEMAKLIEDLYKK